MCHFPRTACKGQALQNRCHPEAEFGLLDNHSDIHQVSAVSYTHLSVKDLINVGLFSVIYFIMFTIAGILGYIPVLSLIHI